MKQASTIHSVDLFMPLWSCHFPSKTKYSGFILGARASPAFFFCDPV